MIKFLKRNFFIRAFILFLLPISILTSCDSKKNEVGAELPSLPKLEDTRGDEPNRKTITTLNGKQVEYDANTKNIVALGGTGDILSLGIRPLAVDGNANSNGFESFFYGVEKLKNTQPFDPEEVLSYHPDLILTYNTMDEKDIVKLEKIAPVIPIYFDTYDFELRINYLGDIFDMNENANTIIQFCKSIEETSIQKLKDLGLDNKTVTVFSYMNGICIPPDFNGAFVFNHILYNVLQLGKNDKVQEYLNNQSQPAYSPVSSEKLREYEGDLNLYASMDESNTIPEVVKTNEGWKSLSCVKNDKVGVIDITLFALKDVLYMQSQYQSLFSALEKAVA